MQDHFGEGGTPGIGQGAIRASGGPRAGYRDDGRGEVRNGRPQRSLSGSLETEIPNSQLFQLLWMLLACAAFSGEVREPGVWAASDPWHGPGCAEGCEVPGEARGTREEASPQGHRRHRTGGVGAKAVRESSVRAHEQEARAPDAACPAVKAF